MTREEFQRLPEYVSAEAVRAVLNVDKRTLGKVVTANPMIRRVVPGMVRPKYVRREVEKLLPA
jgi:hypothetical protein